MSKGGQFERDIAKTLTEWVTGKKSPYVFWRTPSSGQLMTVSQAVDVSGDLMAIRPEGTFLTNKFSFECKNGYPKANFHKHLKGLKNDEIYEFWNECIRDARGAGKRGVLIWRKKNHPIVIGFEVDTAKFFREEKLELPAKSLILNYGGVLPSIEFFDFKDFFDFIPSQLFKKSINKI
jgi:hypothetical protein